MSEHLLPEDIVALARRVVDENRAAGRTIAVAESCTGGLVSAALTEIPGSSDVFVAGFVTYADEAKIALLGVAQDVIATFGAVSLATAWSMAHGAVAKANADVAVAITGIAGPGGGSDRKPVGTVIYARALAGDDPEKALTDERRFGDLGRGGIRHQAALCALELLLPPTAADLA
ncbi:CinA family protein [Sphingomonas bacterium]|uniref:CinA family protein n=1 Tax=Sphingomonas bacterium TaxID=1895847 RepID=UPI00157665EA|nr:CinA family protein [Sphingomonas bacterium]